MFCDCKNFIVIKIDFENGIYRVEENGKIFWGGFEVVMKCENAVIADDLR